MEKCVLDLKNTGLYSDALSLSIYIYIIVCIYIYICAYTNSLNPVGSRP